MQTSSFRETLRSQFGFGSFRPGQEESLSLLFEHKRLLCIQPTGHGKSLLYQLPAATIDGMTLVVSPLLALVRDQVGQLGSRFNIPAAAINSDQTDDQNMEIKARALSGHYKILFVAPEQLDNLQTLEFIKNLPIKLFVVDEAHCISTWGHDFRPAYRQIVAAIRYFESHDPDLMILGLTATADARTEQDIAAQLRGDSGALQVTRHTMDRPELSLKVVAVQGVEDKLTYLRRVVEQKMGFGLLYCSTRDQAELVAEYLQSVGLNVASYHAGYTPEKKLELQQALMAGTYQAIAATNALGMGIDKQDIRYVIHVDLPGSITAYYQEVGRSGRDGRPAQGLLLYDLADRKIQDYFISSAQPSRAEFVRILNVLAPDDLGQYPMSSQVKTRSGLHPTKVNVILADLIEQGNAEKFLANRRQCYRRVNKHEPNLSRFEQQFEVRSKELNSMIAYGEAKVACLMQALRQSLGDQDAQACGRCSLCLGESREIEIDPDDKKACQRWLLSRDIRLAAKRTHKIGEGRAVLNGELRTRAFVRFMQGRTNADSITDELEALIAKSIEGLGSDHSFSAVILMPSMTWKQRLLVGRMVAGQLGVPLLDSALRWNETPASRQGKLYNNDQRKANVDNHMTLGSSPSEIPPGAILLLDDYIGSGHTLSEAARVLRKIAGLKGDIVPFMVARLRWKLGAPGMV